MEGTGSYIQALNRGFAILLDTCSASKEAIYGLAVMLVLVVI